MTPAPKRQKGGNDPPIRYCFLGPPWAAYKFDQTMVIEKSTLLSTRAPTKLYNFSISSSFFHAA